MNDHYHELSSPGTTVTVRVGEQVVARSDNTVRLEEFARGRGMDPVYYFPPEDVQMGSLAPTATQTHCPIKGDAAYWTYQHGDESLVDLAWGYPTPIESSQGIAGLMAFDKRRVSIEVE
jgi:uncharacterized protein (DUF427 family)